MHGQFEYASLLIPIYNNLYDRATALLKRFNPCNICDGVCERYRRGLGRNFCCSNPECVYLGPDGCRVRALRCLLWTCREDLIHPNNRRAFNSEMWNIMIVANSFHLLVPRGSMEDSIAQACSEYTRNKHNRPAMVDLAKNYVPAPLFFTEALAPRLKVPSFEVGQSFAAKWSSFSEGKTPAMAKVRSAKLSDMSEKEGIVELTEEVTSEV